MNVTGKTKIYRKDFDEHPAYSRAITSRKFVNGVKGDWNKPIYESVQFPTGTQIEDGTIVEITKAFESSFETRSGEVKRKLMVQEYTVGERPQNTETQPVVDDYPQTEYSALSDDDMPF